MAPRRKKQRTGSADAGVPPGAHSVGVDVAEAVGRLLITPPDVLNNIQTACRDVAAFACVCKSFNLAAKNTLWRLLGEAYSVAPFTSGVKARVVREEQYERVFLEDTKVRKMGKQPGVKAISEGLQHVASEVPPHIYAEFVRLDNLGTAATNAKHTFCLTDGDLKQLEGVERQRGSLGMARMYRLRDLIVAATAKHGSAEVLAERVAAKAPKKKSHGIPFYMRHYYF